MSRSLILWILVGGAVLVLYGAFLLEPEQPWKLLVWVPSFVSLSLAFTQKDTPRVGLREAARVLGGLLALYAGVMPLALLLFWDALEPWRNPWIIALVTTVGGIAGLLAGLWLWRFLPYRREPQAQE